MPTKRRAPVRPTVPEPTMSNMGGNIDDRPPQPRYFADGLAQRKRRITVSVTKYYGQGQHWHVDIAEEDDGFYLVVPDPPCKADTDWRLSPGDCLLWYPWRGSAEMNGRTAHKAANTSQIASRFVEATLKAWKVTPESHEVRWQDYTTDVNTPANKWYYPDGD